MDKIKARLEYLRGEIEAERISTSEIEELQSLAKYIDSNDILLLEWAGKKEGKSIFIDNAMEIIQDMEDMNI